MRALLRAGALLVLILAAGATARAQITFDQATMKKILSEYSLQMFGGNATGYMGPLVIVSNVGANHGFYSSATVDRSDRLRFTFSVQTVYASVRDDQRSYVAAVPFHALPGDSPELLAFKYFLQLAASTGSLDTLLRTATVFGGQGSFFRIPKAYLRLAGVTEEQLKLIPDSLQLTPGTNQNTVFAAVPQLAIGTWKSTDMLVRYIPPITFDKNIGKFSFFGIAARHGFTNHFRRPVVNAAVQMSYQHTTIENTVGTTKAQLSAATDMYSINVHAGRRFGWFEPFAGLSYEMLRSSGSYRFTLPATVVAQIGYDIDPQTAHIALQDNSFKATIGASAYWRSLSLFASVGFSKHTIFGGGLSVSFDPPFVSK